MTETAMTRDEAVRIWRNGRVPVIFKPAGTGPLLVRLRVPISGDTQENREWVLGSGRVIHWLRQFGAWAIPRSRFAEIVRRALARYSSAYLIQEYRRMQKCAPACWQAEGPDCVCSCMGANHGSGAELAHVVSDTFAFEWGEQEYACRLLTSKNMLRGN